MTRMKGKEHGETVEHDIEKDKYREQVKMNKGGGWGWDKGRVTRWSEVHPPGSQAITLPRQQLVTERLTADLTNRSITHHTLCTGLLPRSHTGLGDRTGQDTHLGLNHHTVLVLSPDVHSFTSSGFRSRTPVCC